MQDIEFTIENGKVWLLQTRRAKRTGLAALRIAVDMVEEHMFSPKEALLRIEPEQLNHLLRPVFDDTEKKQAIVSGRLLACGLAAGPGAASGKVVFSAARAEELAAAGQPVILVRQETSPEDIKGMYVSQGILTARGGMTSHAALVSRQMGKVCVVGCSELDIDYGKRSLRVKERSIAEGDELSLDGTTGEIIVGNLQTRQSEVLRAVLEQDPASRKSPAYRLYARLMEWADCVRILGIRANADQADQAAVALALGAEGIGLCRTEHMFFGEPKITYMREMILAETEEARKAALAKLLPIQRRDFESLFRTMNGKPVTIRTLDPPLHEFLPQGPDDISRVAATLGIAAEQIEQRLHSLKELNPMLGHRGCRLGITYPEITRMQARAIAEAACQLKKESIDVYPEIMIPLVAYENELLSQVQLVQEEIALVMEEQGVQFAYQIGTMIELPRAALIADVLARTAQFFSFGTNDLTQTALGVSRDDAGRFLTPYLDQNIIPSDPFRSIDRQGVGQLMRFAVEKALSIRPDCKLGICGEQGGDPDSVAFCAELGLDYVSASPYRLPIARLAAAQAALAAGMKKNDKA